MTAELLEEAIAVLERRIWTWRRDLEIGPSTEPTLAEIVGLGLDREEAEEFVAEWSADEAMADWLRVKELVEAFDLIVSEARRDRIQP